MRNKNPLIGVMGTMGSGKTTVATQLAKNLNFILVEEKFSHNPFLKKFYESMEKWAFSNQLFFLKEKILSLKETAEILKKRGVVFDTPLEQNVYCYTKTQYQLGLISKEQWHLYEDLYHYLKNDLPQPDIIIHVSVAIETIRKRIHQRARKCEQNLDFKYLTLLHAKNQEWLSAQKKIPVLHFDNNEERDFVHNQATFQELALATKDKLDLIKKF